MGRPSKQQVAEREQRALQKKWLLARRKKMAEKREKQAVNRKKYARRKELLQQREVEEAARNAERLRIEESRAARVAELRAGAEPTPEDVNLWDPVLKMEMNAEWRAIKYPDVEARRKKFQEQWITKAIAEGAARRAIARGEDTEGDSLTIGESPWNRDHRRRSKKWFVLQDVRKTMARVAAQKRGKWGRGEAKGQKREP